jgi:hypothetical protein
MATESATDASTIREHDMTITPSGDIKAARSGVTGLIERLPSAVRATGARARGATTALQRLPDSRLRLLAAGSIGLAAGFRLAGAPRLVSAAGIAPAVFVGAAIALRPIESAAPAETATSSPHAGSPRMAAAPGGPR